jgi:hypothetical protein
MFPIFTLALAHDAVARQFDYDDSSAFTADVAPIARPRRRRSSVVVLGRLFRGAAVPTA